MPPLKVADPETIERRAHARAGAARLDAGAAVVLFPELGISAYSNDDLSGRMLLLEASVRAVERIVRASEALTRC